MVSLGNFFGKKMSPVLGLDIGMSSIRLVEIGKTSAGRLVLERCLVEPLPANAMAQDGSAEEFDLVVDAVKRIVKKSGTRTKHVVAALPASAVIAKKVLVPTGLSDDAMDEHIEGEASQYIPFSIDEVSLDYCVLGESASSPGDEEVMIIAARREKVEDMQAVMSAAGLQLKVLDVASYAAQRATGRLIENLPNKGRGALVALTHLGATTTHVYIVRNGVVLFEREQAFGGSFLTEQIARQYGMTQQEAESKKISGHLPDDYAELVLRPFVDRMAQEIHSALQFFYNSTPYKQVSYVLLSGGCASLSGLKEVMAGVVGAPCVLADPFDGMEIGPQVQERKLRKDAPAFLTACGLAMRRFSS